MMDYQNHGENEVFIAFYIAALAVGFLCPKPKLAFYLTVLLSIGACVLLFHIGYAIEMGGLAHTTPFAIVPWWMSRRRQERRRKLKTGSTDAVINEGVMRT